MTTRVFFRSKLIRCSTCHQSQQIIFPTGNNPKRYFYDEVNLHKMPKDQKQRIVQMQMMRMRAKIKSVKFPTSNFSLTVLGSGSYSGSCSLYVNTDHVRYMFNCGEGTQRLANEHKLKLAKVEHIFVTNANWCNLGGTPGMVLTLQNEGIPKLTIHGPPRSIDMFSAMKNFVAVKDLDVLEAQCTEDKPFDDQVMKVWYVPIIKPRTSNVKQSTCTLTIDDIDYYAYENNTHGKRKLHDGNSMKKIQKTIENVSQDEVMCYICKIHEKPSKLCLELCVEKNVPPGPLMGQLKAGNDVTLPDGTLVKSNDVCIQENSQTVFLVVECPSLDYLDQFVNHPAFGKHQATAPDETDVAKCIVHFTPKEILDNPKYRDWMRKFGQATEHLVINEENTNDPSTEAVYKYQQMLHLIHPEIFPILNDKSLAEKPQNQLKITDKDDNLQVYQGKTLLSYHLRPQKGLCTENLVTIKPESYIQEAFQIEGFLDALAELQTEISSRTKSLTDTSEYPKILLLGTGSSVPNKVRNTSGILFHVNEDSSILLDCGEGTIGQIIRFYGATKAKKILSTIKAISISHLHADHHIGLIGVLQARKKVTTKPIYLLAPETITCWLQLYDKRVEPIMDQYVLIPNNAFLPNNVPLEIKDELYKELNVREINTVHVYHCPYSYGTLITLNDGRRVVYSGDTMPCDRLVELGKDCTLLIHEATMDDDLEREARIKHHSTFSQAINIGKTMNAEFTLLTHFSQRYAKLPLLPDNDNMLQNVGIAFDNMQVSLSQLPLLPLFYPCLKVLFQEYIILLQKKVYSRGRKLEN